MRIQNVFYTVGVLFIISAVIYFTHEFFAELPPEIKFMMLAMSVVISFIVAEFLRGSDI